VSANDCRQYSLHSWRGALAGCLLASGGVTKVGKGMVEFWDVKRGTCVGNIETGSPVSCLAALAKGELAAGLEDGTVRVWQS